MGMNMDGRGRTGFREIYRRTTADTVTARVQNMVSSRENTNNVDYGCTQIQQTRLVDSMSVYEGRTALLGVKDL